MSQMLQSRILDAMPFDEPLRRSTQDHFNRTAFVMGQKNCLEAQHLYLTTRINIRPILPTFKTLEEVAHWWEGVESEMNDCVDVMLALQDGCNFYLP